MLRHLVRWSLVLIVITASGVGIWWATRPKPVEVAVKPVTRGMVERTVANTRAGTVKACRRAKLSPSTGGQIAQLPIHEGDAVKEGQLLLEIWNEDLKAQAALAERQIASARSRARSACLRARLAQRNADRLTFVAAATCTFGLYDSPGVRSGTELLILEEEITSLADTVIMTPTQDDIALLPSEMGTLHGRLDVHNAEYMAARLGAVSLANFKAVITTAVERSGYTLDDLRFVGITHMKRSFYEQILAAVGLAPEQSVYLDHYGHIQSVDQVLALRLGLDAGIINPGDLIVLAGAGTGYTWSATAVRWG